MIDQGYSKAEVQELCGAGGAGVGGGGAGAPAAKTTGCWSTSDAATRR